MIKWGDRLRIAFVMVVLSVWIFIIDGLNYIINFDEGFDASNWAVYLIIISGLMFGIFGTVASLMIFCWYQPKMAGMISIGISILCGTLRLLCVIFGFKDFSEEQHLNSTTNSTTDIAIACFQFYMVIEGIFIMRNWNQMGVQVYEPVDQH